MAKESTIQHYNSSSAGNLPSAADLTAGEFAINIDDEKVFLKNAAGTVLSLSQTKDLSGNFAKGSEVIKSINVGVSGASFTGTVGLSAGSGIKLTTSTNPKRVTIDARLTLKGAIGTIPFTDNTVEDVSSDSNFKFDYLGDLSFHVPASIKLGRTFSSSGLEFGDGTTQSTAYSAANSVNSFNGSTGAVSYAPPLASASVTGVAHFPSSDFAVSATGSVTLSNVARTNAANTFTALQTFSAGISASSGVTFSADISVNGHKIGRGAGNSDTNIVVGRLALGAGSTGTNVTAVGVQAADQNEGTGVIAIGYQAGYYNHSDSLVAIGAGAAVSNTGAQNICIGGNAGNANNAAGIVAVGFNACTNNTGAGVVGLGAAAGAAGSGALLVAIGSNAGYGNAGYGSVAIGGYAMLNSCSGNRNTAIGSNAMDAATIAANNTSIGAHSLTELTTGESNVAIGGYAGQLLTTGSNNVILGFEADVATAGNNNSIVIGKGAVGLGSNTTVIGVAATTSATIYGRLNLPSGLSASGATFSGNISAPNIVNSVNGLTGAVTVSTSISWSVGNTNRSLTANTGLFANKGTLLTLTLPVSSSIGDTIKVSGMTAGLWNIAQNASQVIHFGKSDTTVGTGGYLQSTLARDSVEMVCCVTNNEWNVVSAVGNITIT